MKKLTSNKCFILLVFLAFFGFSIGLFDNYRDLWLSSNNISTLTISHIKSISYIITVLVLFFFTLKVSSSKLKNGITITIVLKMITSSILLCLNNTSNLFLIKFLMFFDIAFTQVIVSSIYPLMLKFARGDELYTKKEVIESLFNKLGFFLVSILLGKMIFGTVIDYNICLLLSLIFTFIAFIIIINFEIEEKKESAVDIKEAIKYFNKNKVLYLFLITNLIASITWSSMIGMPLLTLTKTLNLSPKISSFLILGLGIISNLLAIIVVKYLRSKNDYINLFFKFGFRIIIYLLVFLTNDKLFLLISLITLLITDCTYNFIFASHFTNIIDEKYSLLLIVLKYCTSLIGNAVGVSICGLVFNLSIKYIALPALIIGIIHYILASILVHKKRYSLI
ncbi:MAG: hypothetical protein HFI36_03050 [Bacilli bacterium]|jgi:hypothetical protein|nr:hypothetical protein [Bacilli bacterium]